MASVSVIVPNYNHARFLHQRLDSMFNQTYQDFEVILLDDASTDNSVEILQEYAKNPKVGHFVVDEINSGSPFVQWKKGIELAKGEYIWIAESDDWADKRFLETLIKELEKNEDLGLVVSGSNWIDDLGNIRKDLSVQKQDLLIDGKLEVTNRLLFRNSIQNVSSVLFHHKVFDDITVEYDQVKACGDWYLYIDILNRYSVKFLSIKLNYFRWYHNNVTNQAAKDKRWIVEGCEIINIIRQLDIKIDLNKRHRIIYYWLCNINLLPIEKRKECYNKIKLYKDFFILVVLIEFKIKMGIIHPIKKWIKIQ